MVFLIEAGNVSLSRLALPRLQNQPTTHTSPIPKPTQPIPFNFLLIPLETAAATVQLNQLISSHLMSSPSQANPQTQTQDRPSTPPPRAGQTTDSKLTHPAPSPSPSTHSPLPKRAKPTTALASAFDPPATATSTSTPTPTPSAPPAPAPASASASASETMSKLPLPSPPQQQLLIKLLTPSAQPPKRGSAFAAGYDIFAAAPATIPARGKALVSTGLSMAVPEGTYGRIAPRSGLAAKHHIDTGAGVIDADYRGEVKILLFNHAETDFQVELGDRVAQLIVERIYTPEVAVVEELEASVRGAGGFGSTGVGVSDGKTA